MVKTYRKIPYEVQAIKFERGKQDEIRTFCNDIRIITERHPNGKMRGTFTNMDGMLSVIEENDYLIKDENGYHKYDDYVFNCVFEEIK